MKPGLAQEASVAAAAPLIVYDSLGGQPLAQAVTADNSWREFVAYRMATADSPVVVSLALRSYGEAMVDDVTVVPLQQWGTSTSGNSPPPASGESVRR